MIEKESMHILHPFGWDEDPPRPTRDCSKNIKYFYFKRNFSEQHDTPPAEPMFCSQYVLLVCIYQDST
jgi:hypothetical protein